MMRGGRSSSDSRIWFCSPWRNVWLARSYCLTLKDKDLPVGKCGVEKEPLPSVMEHFQLQVFCSLTVHSLPALTLPDGEDEL